MAGASWLMRRSLSMERFCSGDCDRRWKYDVAAPAGVVVELDEVGGEEEGGVVEDAGAEDAGCVCRQDAYICLHKCADIV
jgi:hypothetical protein